MWLKEWRVAGWNLKYMFTAFETSAKLHVYNGIFETVWILCCGSLADWNHGVSFVCFVRILWPVDTLLGNASVITLPLRGGVSVDKEYRRSTNISMDTEIKGVFCRSVQTLSNKKGRIFSTCYKTKRHKRQTHLFVRGCYIKIITARAQLIKRDLCLWSSRGLTPRRTDWW
jgi:hypothetical protein